MDHLRALFNLRPGLQWTDGSPLTSADSVFSYQLARSEEILYGNAGLVTGSAASVTFTADYTAVDANTVLWTGLPGFLDPNYPLNFFSPLPAEQLAGIPILDLLEREDVLYSPSGWGPYRVTSWTSGESLTLEANPNYYLASEGLPAIREIVLRVVGQDPATSLLAFGLGECDLLLQDSLPDVLVDDLLLAGDMYHGSVYASLQPLYEQLTFNISPADPQQPALFAETRLRQAAAYCIDRPGLAELVYAGFVPALEMSLPRDHPLLQGAPTDLFRYDPQQAGRILDELGWQDTNGDGLREAHGVTGIEEDLPLIVRLSVPESELRGRVSERLAAQLQVCGFQVMLESAPARDLFAQNAEAAGSGRRFELLETASPMTVDGLCGLAETERISGEANAWSGSNLSGYSLPALDDACSSMRAALPGTEDYIASRQAVLRIMNETIPLLPLFVYTNFTVARSDLLGVTTGLGQGELQDLERFRWGP
jgi:peptide/nickel transport system substrate-binding protein